MTGVALEVSVLKDRLAILGMTWSPERGLDRRGMTSAAGEARTRAASHQVEQRRPRADGA